jgi:hypothetical protein
MRQRALWIAISLVFTISAGANAAETRKKKPARAIPAVSHPSAEQKIAATRALLIERMRASRQKLRDALPYYESEIEKQSADYELKKQMYEASTASFYEVEESGRRLANTQQTKEQVERWITEDDIALSLTREAAEEQSEKLGPLPPGGFDRTASYIRYNGTRPWSLADTPKIAKFFLTHFGHSLPISALGQSRTHDRMSLDHRGAVDVPISPDSVEGRGLMAYLQRNRIPFIAFRRRVPSMSTGAHIHIGPPSPALIEVRRHDVPAATSEATAQGG